MYECGRGERSRYVNRWCSVVGPMENGVSLCLYVSQEMSNGLNVNIFYGYNSKVITVLLIGTGLILLRILIVVVQSCAQIARRFLTWF